MLHVLDFFLFSSVLLCTCASSSRMEFLHNFPLTWQADGWKVLVQTLWMHHPLIHLRNVSPFAMQSSSACSIHSDSQIPCTSPGNSHTQYTCGAVLLLPLFKLKTSLAVPFLLRILFLKAHYEEEVISLFKLVTIQWQWLAFIDMPSQSHLPYANTQVAPNLSLF
jgi:hypothetical protein